ncbi:UpxY family transcription antiterminator [Ascidiimonas sp. W6]|uniref:UpxY family transcription antiterminator n=1 Tax=Ascidiimonas meishanensis TaxID=3128903 RepID=UPI0030ED56D9
MSLKLKNWYVLYVKSKQEKKVHERLKELQIESFLPMIQTISNWSDRKKLISKPLFPSYIFVKLRESKDFNLALSVTGACLYLKTGKTYSIVRQEEIEAVKVFLGLDGLKEVEVKRNLPKPGEIQKITSGPLCGKECEIINVNNINKIVVRLNSINQSIIARIPLYYLNESKLISA